MYGILGGLGFLVRLGFCHTVLAYTPPFSTDNHKHEIVQAAPLNLGLMN